MLQISVNLFSFEQVGAMGIIKIDFVSAGEVEFMAPGFEGLKSQDRHPSLVRGMLSQSAF